MRTSAALIFCLGVALTCCATSHQTQQLVKNATPLDRELFNAVSADQFESASFISSRGTTLPYRLLRPTKQTPGKAYPLVVQLHGSGGIGTDNLGQLDRMAKSWAMPEIRDRYQAFVLIPQFPIRSANYGPVAPDQHAVHSQALNDAFELINDFSSANPVDASRVYATGFSMGGSATWLLPQLAPGVFAGIVPVSGIAPPNAQAVNFITLPVLAIHGNADTENPITADKRFIEAISSQGGRNATLREYEGLDHQPPSDLYPGYWWRDWLFNQSRK